MKYSLLLLLPLALGGFAAFWCLVVKLVSLLGWQRLATPFRTASPPPGPWFRLGQARVGRVSYQGAMQAAPSAQGLGLATGFPFRIGHPPLLIPWAALGPFQAAQFLWITTYTTRVRTSATDSITLSFSSTDVIEAARPWIQVVPAA